MSGTMGIYGQPDDDEIVLTDDDLGTGDPKCPVVLLLDTSSSMSGHRISQLNNGLKALSDALNSDPGARRRIEVLVIPFDSSVHDSGDFALAQSWVPPHLSARGSTAMGAAIRTGIARAVARRREIQASGLPSYVPWVFLLTDGGPTDSVADIPHLVQEHETNKKVIFWSIAAQGANVGTLRTFTPDKPILGLDDTDWSSLFIWISAAVSSVAASNPGQQVTLPAWTITA